MSAAPVESSPAPSDQPAPSGAPASTPAPFKFAGAPAPSGEQGSSAPPPAPEPIKLHDWMGTLDEDGAAYVKGKGWTADGKSFADVVKAHRAAEGFIGRPADQVMVKPDWSKPESVAEYRASKGAPAEAGGYTTPETKLPVGLVDGPRVAAISHVLGHSQEEHEVFVAETAKFFHEAFAKHAEEVSMRRAAERAQLEREMGGNWKPFQESVQGAITGLGLTEEDYDVLVTALGGSEKAAQTALSKIARGMREGTPGDQGNSGPSFGIATVEQAQADVAKMQATPGFLNLLQGTGPEADAARDRWSRAMAIIAPKD